MIVSDKLHLLGHEAELFSRQEVEIEDEPPVKVAVSVQRPVVDVSLLLVLLHAWHPAGNANNSSFVILQLSTLHATHIWNLKETNIIVNRRKVDFRNGC